MMIRWVWDITVVQYATEEIRARFPFPMSCDSFPVYCVAQGSRNPLASRIKWLLFGFNCKVSSANWLNSCIKYECAQSCTPTWALHYRSIFFLIRQNQIRKTKKSKWTKQFFVCFLRFLFHCILLIPNRGCHKTMLQPVIIWSVLSHLFIHFLMYSHLK